MDLNNSSNDEFIKNWLETSKITSLIYNIEPEYFGEEPDNPEYYLEFYLRNTKDDYLQIDIPLDGISNPEIYFWSKGYKLKFYGDVSICELLLKIIEAQFPDELFINRINSILDNDNDVLHEYDIRRLYSHYGRMPEMDKLRDLYKRFCCKEPSFPKK